MPKRTQPAAIVGVAEHGNSAVLVTVAQPAELLDRRRIDLTEPGTPTHPYHHEGAWAVGRYLESPWARPITLADAVALIEHVTQAAARGADRALLALAASVSAPISGISLRICPVLPATIQERIADNRAQTVADSVMYRQALAGAAGERGWAVHWYNADTVFDEAARALGRADIASVLQAMGRAVGPPWQAKHKLAAAAAIAGLSAGSSARAARAGG